MYVAGYVTRCKIKETKLWVTDLPVTVDHDNHGYDVGDEDESVDVEDADGSGVVPVDGAGRAERFEDVGAHSHQWRRGGDEGRHPHAHHHFDGEGKVEPVVCVGVMRETEKKTWI